MFRRRDLRYFGEKTLKTDVVAPRAQTLTRLRPRVSDASLSAKPCALGLWRKFPCTILNPDHIPASYVRLVRFLADKYNKTSFGTTAPSFQEFNGSTTARGYAVMIKYVNAYHGETGRFVNEGTMEVLSVAHSRTGRSVEVERKPMDEK